MEIFLSWSGNKSQRIAEFLKTWIPTVIQATKPFYSTEDIAKGKRWSLELAKKLENCEFGIIIMTDENVKAPWILFEAGALSKNIQTGSVCIFLAGIKDTDLQGPLSQFQNTKFIKTDVLKLLKEINKQLNSNSIENSVLEVTFEKMWPDLENKLNEILSSNSSQSKNEILRTDRELIEEILTHTRQLKYKHLFREKSYKNLLNNNKSQVIFEEDTECIVFYYDDQECYHIGLDQLKNTGEVLDFIFQVNGKGWVTQQHIKGFVDCLEELSSQYFNTSAQGVICPGGSYKDIKWNK